MNNLSQHDDEIRAAMVAEGTIIDHAESMRNPDMSSLSEKFEDLNYFAEEHGITVSAWALCCQCSRETKIEELADFDPETHNCGCKK